MRSVGAYIADMLAEIGDIELFVLPGKDAFFADRMRQKAVMRSYEILGEIVKRIPLALLNGYPAVPWKDLTGFRDVLIHQYHGVDLSRVWAAVEQLPALRAAVEAMASDPLVTADDDEA